MDPLFLMLAAMYTVAAILIHNLATSANPRVVLAMGFVVLLVALTSYGVYAS